MGEVSHNNYFFLKKGKSKDFITAFRSIVLLLLALDLSVILDIAAKLHIKHL